MAQLSSLGKEYAAEQEMLTYRAAMICSIIAEVNRDRKKRSKAFTPSDFMPKKKADIKMTGEQMREQAELMNAALGGGR